MSLEILLGPMFSGKSSRILSLVRRYTAIGTKVLVIKHASDTRYDANNMVTHDGHRAECLSVWDLDGLALRARLLEYNVIIVEEAQFFKGLVAFSEYVVDTLEKKLYLVGLDGDSNRRMFGELLECIPLADRVEKLTSFCARCANGTPGIFTYRHSGPQDQQMIVGGADMYTSVCRECYLRQFMENATA
jgi:thymidine kinase